jgi:uncharacterized protein involved in exopolysaccharide biosynthesis
MSDVEIAGLLLTPEQKRAIENDATLRTLVLNRMQCEQELAIEKGISGSNRVAELTTRLGVIDKQIRETRDKLLLDALASTAKTLEDEAVSKKTLASYFGQLRKDKEVEVTTLGQRLLQWDQMVADVKQLQDTLNKMRTEEILLKANQSVDDTRVKPVIDVAATPVPAEPSWPEWPPFVGTGAAAGLAAGALAALVLAFARVRRFTSPALPAANAFPMT